jgi:hypothetical protein
VNLVDQPQSQKLNKPATFSWKRVSGSETPDIESGDERAIGEETGPAGFHTGEVIAQRVLGRYSRLVLNDEPISQPEILWPTG